MRRSAGSFIYLTFALIFVYLICLGVLLKSNTRNQKIYSKKLVASSSIVKIDSKKETKNISLSEGPFLNPISENSPTPTLSPVPTLPPSPSSVPTRSITPTPTNKPKSESSSGLFIDAINSYREQKGLSRVSSNAETCSFANTRAIEIASSFNHDGFTNRADSKTLPYGSYSVVTENIAQNSDPSKIINMWINSPSHAANMQKNTPFVCVAQYGSYFAYEGWKP